MAIMRRIIISAGESGTTYTRLRARFLASGVYRLWLALDGDISFHARPGRGRLIDIGCNEGRGLSLYAGNGFAAVEGLETNPVAAAAARRRGFVVHGEAPGRVPARRAVRCRGAVERARARARPGRDVAPSAPHPHAGRRGLDQLSERGELAAALVRPALDQLACPVPHRSFHRRDLEQDARGRRFRQRRARPGHARALGCALDPGGADRAPRRADPQPTQAAARDAPDGAGARRDVPAAVARQFAPVTATACCASRAAPHEDRIPRLSGPCLSGAAEPRAGASRSYRAASLFRRLPIAQGTAGRRRRTIHRACACSRSSSASRIANTIWRGAGCRTAAMPHSSPSGSARSRPTSCSAATARSIRKRGCSPRRAPAAPASCSGCRMPTGSRSTSCCGASCPAWARWSAGTIAARAPLVARLGCDRRDHGGFSADARCRRHRSGACRRDRELGGARRAAAAARASMPGRRRTGSPTSAYCSMPARWGSSTIPSCCAIWCAGFAMPPTSASWSSPKAIGADHIARVKAAEGLDNLVLLPFQPLCRAARPGGGPATCCWSCSRPVRGSIRCPRSCSPICAPAVPSWARCRSTIWRPGSSGGPGAGLVTAPDDVTGFVAGGGGLDRPARAPGGGGRGGSAPMPSAASTSALSPAASRRCSAARPRPEPGPGPRLDYEYTRHPALV